MVLKICSDIALKFCMSFLCREPRRDSRYRRDSRHTQSRLVLDEFGPQVSSRYRLGIVSVSSRNRDQSRSRPKH